MNTELPEFGKWLLDRNKRPSLWLNRKIEGKVIWEPINVILKDSVSESEEESKNLLNKFLINAGFKIRWGHISPRYAEIGGVVYNFLPVKFFHAYSDRIWLKQNNHGRFFGPHKHNELFYYCGAVSRETAVTHKYVSFTLARNQFAKMLIEKSRLISSEFIDMNNQINSESETTGDHDGKAILLILS